MYMHMCTEGDSLFALSIVYRKMCMHVLLPTQWNLSITGNFGITTKFDFFSEDVMFTNTSIELETYAVQGCPPHILS